MLPLMPMDDFRLSVLMARDGLFFGAFIEFSPKPVTFIEVATVPVAVSAPVPLVPSLPKVFVVTEEMESDIKRIVTSIAIKYTDQSCMFLHQDEIEAECWCKLVKAQPEGAARCRGSRAKFFGYVKTALMNHVRSLVQRHRFTRKRTGLKPPPKNSLVCDFRSYKPHETSLDDPDSGLQVGEESDESLEYVNELTKEILENCNAIQQMVFKQLTEPNASALNLAILESNIGKLPDKVRIHISKQHMAEGLGLSLEVFEKTVLEVQRITQRVKDMPPEDQTYNCALANLTQIFGLQIPKSTPPMIVRRLLTITARDNWQKIDANVEDMLHTVGAVAPKFNKSTMSCFGVLYQKGHRICEACGLKESCKIQAANIGLGDITISPKLLGARASRTPYLVPVSPMALPMVTANPRDMEIVEYLAANFRKVTNHGEIHFQPIDFQDKQKLLFCVGDKLIPLRLRFHQPLPAVRAALVADGKHFIVPESMPADEVIELIMEHTKSAYAIVATSKSTVTAA